MTKQTRDIITIISLLVFAALLLVFGPLAIIWSLNTLFPLLAIPYGFLQWLAVIVMNCTIFAKSALTFKRD